MYKSVKEFKSLEVSIKTKWDRWDCKGYKIYVERFMYKQ